ncbi:MAG: hypothetical protein GY952_06755 [Rhodobacteraceae bacterium]|nr:hypothetical protein [Paracoccaceae bacterium]
MKAKFIGDPNDKGSGSHVPKVSADGKELPPVHFGYTFPRGKWVDIPAEDVNATVKISGNSHFECKEA